VVAKIITAIDNRIVIVAVFVTVLFKICYYNL